MRRDRVNLGRSVGSRHTQPASELLGPENVLFAFIVAVSVAMFAASLYLATHGMPEMGLLAAVPLGVCPIAYQTWRRVDQ